MQLKTSKQLMKARQCLVHMGVPAHDDTRLWKVRPAGAHHHERQRIQKCSLKKNNIPTRITLRGKALDWAMEIDYARSFELRVVS